MPIWLYALKRLLIALPLLVAVSIVGFTLMRFDIEIGPYTVADPFDEQPYTVYLHWKNPIDPLANLRQNPQISPETLKAEEERLGLNLSMPEQYLRWMGGVFNINHEALNQGKLWNTLQPNLGKTHAGEDVAWLIMDRAKNSLILNIFTILFTWLVAVPLGVMAAVRWRTIADRLLTVLAAMGMAAPSFVIAILLAMLMVKTGWLPIGGIRSPNYDELNPVGKFLDMASHMILPIFVLSIGGISGLQRQMRGNLLDVLGSDYVRTARLKGLPETVVLYKHAVRNAINPLITMMGYEFAHLLSGALLVETVLQYPGIGQLMFAAAIQGDTNLVMASLIMSAFLLVLGNLLADILLKYADPRVELA